jgi:hypothetical protein
MSKDRILKYVEGEEAKKLILDKDSKIYLCMEQLEDLGVIENWKKQGALDKENEIIDLIKKQQKVYEKNVDFTNGDTWQRELLMLVII